MLLRLPFETLFEYLKVTRPVCVMLGFCAADHKQGRSIFLAPNPPRLYRELEQLDRVRGMNVALQSLRSIAEALRPLGRHAVFYLAAAVSDFYIPWPQMVSPINFPHNP